MGLAKLDRPCIFVALRKNNLRKQVGEKERARCTDLQPGMGPWLYLGRAWRSFNRISMCRLPQPPHAGRAFQLRCGHNLYRAGSLFPIPFVDDSHFTAGEN